MVWCRVQGEQSGVLGEEYRVQGEWSNAECKVSGLM